MNCIFIYNPVSGKGRIRKRIKYVVDKLREKYEIVDVYETRACGDMTAAAYTQTAADAACFMKTVEALLGLVKGTSAWASLPVRISAYE